MRHLKKETWPYSILMDKPVHHNMWVTSKEYNEVDDWCDNNIGVFCVDWFSFSKSADILEYAFKKAEDAVVFKLKWKGR